MQVYHSIPHVEIVSGRKDFVVQMCRGKRVLHLGCVDEGLLQEQYTSGDLLHLRLMEVADELWGLDISQQGIEFLTSQGVPNLAVANVEHLDSASSLKDQEFDVIVASELIEHLGNPGLFLLSAMDIMGKDTTMLLTVPNAYRIGSLMRMLRRKEYVHPDHNYWFSYRTITSLVRKYGYSIDRIYVYVSGHPGIGACLTKKNRPVRWIKCIGMFFVNALLLRINPFFGDGIILLLRQG